MNGLFTVDMRWIYELYDMDIEAFNLLYSEPDMVVTLYKLAHGLGKSWDSRPRVFLGDLDDGHLVVEIPVAGDWT